MANDISNPNASSAPTRLPKSTVKDIRKNVRGSFAQLVDVAMFERKIGKRIRNITVLRRMLKEDTFILEAADTQREIAARLGLRGEAVDLVGTPAKPTFFRDVLDALLAKTPAGAEVELVCMLRPGHPGLAALEAAVNGGLIEIAEQEGITYDLPTFRAVGGGLDQGQLKGHDPEIMAKWKQLVADEVKALAPPPAA